MTWLRRNLAALIVIVLALPALAFVLVGVPLLEGAGPDEITVVKQGEPLEVSGYTITLTATEEFVGTGTGPGTNNIPLGTSIIGALFDAEPGDNPEEASCETDLTIRAGATERLWPTVVSPTEFDYAVGEDRTTVCLFDGDAFELEAVFLAPTGVYDDATIDLSVGFANYRFVPDRN